MGVDSFSVQPTHHLNNVVISAFSSVDGRSVWLNLLLLALDVLTNARPNNPRCFHTSLSLPQHGEGDHSGGGAEAQVGQGRGQERVVRPSRQGLRCHQVPRRASWRRGDPGGELRKDLY